MADPHQIRQVFVNLLSNAFDSLLTGGHLIIQVREEAEYIQISFSNDGPVIPDEIRKRIFEPFFSTKAYGIGLGLPITYRIVENHNGQILMESKEGQGTTFTVVLPVIPT
ncbi:sensor histidine kinase [Effusibacillus dendaii]|uniref:histidine kinase n=1 Tax=Effusibacillus dendaii TaxID=2743772 RepID=A0A7I8D8H8_9BACL|nr:ATP-binding protein [Effusibacillus dendaii]BCJ86385.1 hypothetical protein skT53_13700 [Effusibacillus dendaii]